MKPERNDIHFDAADFDGSAAADSRLTDREVPLPGAMAADSPTDQVFGWLDGEVPELAARKADSRRVEFWKRVDLEADRLRNTRAPAHLAAQIMAAIPVREPGPGARPAPVRSADIEQRVDR